MALLNLTFFGVDAFVPFMLTNVRDQSPLVAGIVVTSATLSWTAGTWVLERNAARWSRGTMIGAGFALVALGTLGLMLVLSQAVPVAVAVAAWGVAGFGIGIAYPGLSLAALSAAGDGREGAVATSIKTGEFTAAAIGAGGTGAIVAAGESDAWLTGSLALSFALMAVVALLAVATARRLEPAAAETSPAGLAAATGGQ
jgi:predicted MFS family arabinose efflux permease